VVFPVKAAAVAMVIATCLVGAGQAGARSHGGSYPMSARYGGVSHRVDTIAKARAFWHANGHRSLKQLERAFGGLSPRDRSYVAQAAYRVRRLVVKVSAGPVRSTHHSGAQIACVHPNYNWAVTSRGYAYGTLGLGWIYESSWQWGGGCDNVVYAHHQETGIAKLLGVHYVSSHYGQHYGAIGTHMVGRETFGYFDWNLAYLNGQDTADMQVQVNGDPGKWFWFGWYGP
jgi:hypothetical protein